ncbi:guanylate-binding protein 1-like, partial [Hipposideros larvatus]
PFYLTPSAGFSLGSTVQSHTKGIWMSCVSHPEKPNRTLVLLDTEGLGDVEKGDNQNDSWIFALAIILSSTFVYNSMGTINQQAMDQLHYVTELTDRIRANSSPDASEVEDSAAFVSFFPDFVWTLREVSLDLEADGQPISADQYLENSLKLKEGTSQKDKNINLPRLCIQKCFPKKKCFIFDRPTHWKKLGQLAEEILQVYLKSKESVTDAILQTDQTLTEKEKEIEVQHVKAESAEAAAKMLEEMQVKNQQMMEQNEESHQEHVKQLTEKMESERTRLMAEQERTLALKLEEQAWLLNEGFKSESRQLHHEIENLKKNMEKPRPRCTIS